MSESHGPITRYSDEDSKPPTPAQMSESLGPITRRYSDEDSKPATPAQMSETLGPITRYSDEDSKPATPAQMSESLGPITKRFNVPHRHINMEETLLIFNALCGGPDEEVVINAFNLKLTRKDLQSISSPNWLNDQIINFYFCMLEQDCNKVTKTVFVFSTFFYTRLAQDGYKGVEKWTKRVDLFTFDRVLVPINYKQHWSLVVLDVKSKTISYFDSMLMDNYKFIRAVKDYLLDEHLAKRGIRPMAASWTCKFEKNIPRQYNSSDCGVFTCMFAHYICHQKKLDFDHTDMVYFRKRMIVNILQSNIS